MQFVWGFFLGGGGHFNFFPIFMTELNSGYFESHFNLSKDLLNFTDLSMIY